MREQRIAAELGKTAGKDFPDVIGSGATYESRTYPQPNPVPSIDSLPVAPMGYFGPDIVHPTPPSWREADGSFRSPRDVAATARWFDDLVPDLRPDSEENTANRQPVRYLSSRITGMSAPSGLPAGATAPAFVPLDANADPREARIADRSGGVNASAPAVASRGPSQPELPLLGLVSGKPMSFYPVQPPIFGFPEPATPNDEDWLMQLLAPRGRR